MKNKHTAAYWERKIQRLRDRIAEKEKRLAELETVFESAPANTKAGDEWEEEYRDINWSVDFSITVNGEDARFWDLTEAEQEQILSAIRGDSYSGTF